MTALEFSCKALAMLSTPLRPERGLVLTGEELERMVEWLGRVTGISPNQ